MEQALRQRDKLLQDLELSDLRNLQLVREVDEHQASVESLNQSRIRWDGGSGGQRSPFPFSLAEVRPTDPGAVIDRDLEQEFRDRLAVLRAQAEQESEALLQQGEREGGALREELRLLRLQEAELREELSAAAQVRRTFTLTSLANL